MLRILVTPSCEIVGLDKVPVTEVTLSSSVAVPTLTVTPDLMFSAVRLAQTTASIVCAPERYCPDAMLWDEPDGVIVSADLLLILPVTLLPAT